MFGGNAGLQATVIISCSIGYAEWCGQIGNHWRIHKGERVQLDVVTGQFVIEVIICIGAIITTVMHGHKFREAELWIDMGMGKIMVHQVR